MGAVCLLALALAACAGDGEPPADKATAAPARSTGDGMVLVFYREFSYVPGVDDIRDEQSVLDCVGEAVRAENPKQKLVPFEDFRRKVFPRLSREAVPRAPEYLTLLLKRPGFHDRLRAADVRYVVYVGGVTETSAPRGGVYCVAGPGAGACLGMVRWDKSSRLGASVLDLERISAMKTLAAEAKGAAYAGMIVVVPFGVPSGTVSTACRRLGRRIAKEVRSGSEK